MKKRSKKMSQDYRVYLQFPMNDKKRMQLRAEVITAHIISYIQKQSRKIKSSS